MKTSTPLPVSRKFLARIRDRVSEVLASIGKEDTDFLELIMAMIHGYLAGCLPQLPAAGDHHYSCHLIFLTLRAEIDAAVVRSRRAREIARRRALMRREAGTETMQPSGGVVSPPASDVTATTAMSEISHTEPEEPVDEAERERLRRLAAFRERERKAREAEVVEVLPDGEVRTTRPDGTVVMKYPDGEIRITRPGGKVIVQFPGNPRKYVEKWLGETPYYEEEEDEPIVMKGAPDRNSLAEQIRRAYGLR